MKLLISAGSDRTQDGCIPVELPSKDPLISEILAEAKIVAVPTLLADYIFRQGTAFLALPSGPKRLDEYKRASDYQLTDGTILWLMCSSVIPD